MITHLYLRGNFREEIFFDRVDFINAWNRLWISAFGTGVMVLSVELLSNHLHIVLLTEGDDMKRVSEFIHYFRMSLSQYFNRRHMVSGSLGSRRFGRGHVCDPEIDGGEDLRDVIAYNLRNVTHHGVTKDYAGWDFSTYGHVFGISRESACYTMATIPSNLRRAYFPLNRQPPESWGVTKDGRIIPPDSVFPRTYIESLFGSREAYEKFCAQPTRREAEGDLHEHRLSLEPPVRSVTDQEVLVFVSQICHIPIPQMCREQKIAVIKAVSEALHGTYVRQLSRIFGVPVSTVSYWLKH